MSIGLPHLVDIQHHIDPMLGSNILNCLHYPINLEEHEKLKRQVDVVLSKDHIQQSLGHCAILVLLTPKNDRSLTMCITLPISWVLQCMWIVVSLTIS
jgi:hypothetical protein